jgi:hypothetical protein
MVKDDPTESLLECISIFVNERGFQEVLAREWIKNGGCIEDVSALSKAELVGSSIETLETLVYERQRPGFFKQSLLVHHRNILGQYRSIPSLAAQLFMVCLTSIMVIFITLFFLSYIYLKPNFCNILAGLRYGTFKRKLIHWSSS